MRRSGRLYFCTLLLFLLASPLLARGQDGALPPSNPFAPSRVPAKYERSRDYDLRHVWLHLKVDWERKTFAGTVQHTLAPLRDGLTELVFDAGPLLQIESCAINGAAAAFTHAKEQLTLALNAPLPRGKEAQVEIVYTRQPPRDPNRANDIPGFYWVLPDRFLPERRPGFWTNGWPETNHTWVPLYDYPNDRTTSEVYVEVPKKWFVLGNGRLEGVEENRETGMRIFHWKMPDSHPTYLLSLAGGEMDVVREKREGVELFYAVPRGEGKYISASFGDTADMIAFFSRTLGVKFPWPKYGQAAMHDFIFGGTENVSATTLTENALVEARSGIGAMDGLVAHELAHQWFGDLITYKDWSQAWLSEGFATYFQQMYTAHRFGKDAFDRNREDALQNYLRESRRYKRPIVTRHYRAPGAILDSHSYPKGALVLHMLRRALGDADFFRALACYLRKHAYQVVETGDLVCAIAETTGRNMQPFFDQWVYKPGHPVIDYDWSWDAANKQVVLNLRQLQDTADGTPIYTLEIPVGMVFDSEVMQAKVLLERREQTFRLPASVQQDAVLLDPGHDLLMERKARTWPANAREAIFSYAPCVLDREAAALSIVDADPIDADLERLLDIAIHGDALRKPFGGESLARVIRRVGERKRPLLRDRFRALLKHKDDSVRAAAITSVGRLPKEAADMDALRALVNEKEPFSVVTAALGTLAEWDADANVDVFKRALTMDSRREVLRLAAINGIRRFSPSKALSIFSNILDQWSRLPRPVHLRAIELLGRNDLEPVEALGSLVLLASNEEEDPQVRKRAIAIIVARNDKPPAVLFLRRLEKESKDTDIRRAAKEAADKIEGK